MMLRNADFGEKDGCNEVMQKRYNEMCKGAIGNVLKRSYLTKHFQTSDDDCLPCPK